MPVPAVAVVAPLTGLRTAAGTVLLAEVDRIRGGTPGTADWQVFRETPDVAHAVAAGDYSAVVGHADPSVADGALDVYRRAGLTCLLPLLPGRAPALSWAPDETHLARALADAALALGATALTVAYDDDHGSTALAGPLAARARATGLAVRTDGGTADGPPVPSAVSGHDPGGAGSGAVLALLAPQHRLPALLRAREGEPWRAVLVVADCGLPSFDALVAAAVRLPVWAVHPEPCLVRRTRAAVAALAAALAEDPSLRGARLAARVLSRSALLLGPGGGLLGEGRRVSRLSAVCPIRAAAREDALAAPHAPAL
ncbi:hypothetical protein ACWD4N_11295 [Streptomyces sp. NPDC002586]